MKVWLSSFRYVRISYECKRLLSASLILLLCTGKTPPRWLTWVRCWAEPWLCPEVAVTGTYWSKPLQLLILQRLHQQLPLILRGAVIRAEILGNASIPQPHHLSCWVQCCTHMQWSSISHFFTSCWRGDVFPSHAATWLLSAGGTRQPPSAWPVVTWTSSTLRLCSYQLPGLRLRETVVLCSGFIPRCCLSQRQPRQTENVWFVSCCQCTGTSHRVALWGAKMLRAALETPRNQERERKSIPHQRLSGRKQ